MRIKFCGVVRFEDALAAVAAGADALGVIFAPSSRQVDVEKVRAIARGVPPLVALVGVFRDADLVEVEAIARAAGLTHLQFHGSESAAQCESLGRPYFKAISLGDRADLERARQFRREAPRGVILAESPAGGGSGRQCDWELARILASEGPLVLAGGLNPENVGAAIERVRPAAVDVSSGIESTPGRKDATRMRDFVKAARTAAHRPGPAPGGADRE